jgi:aminoacrylate hydrolase
MPLVSIGDAELNVEVHGAGRPVLLIAGLGGRLAFWHRQAAAFAERFRAILHDHRGTGASTRSAIAYSVAQMAGDVVRLMDALGIDRADLVGHSTGGAISQHLAVEHPDRVGRIVLSASWAGPDPFFTALFDLRLKILTALGPAAYLADGILRGYAPAWLQAHPEVMAATAGERLASFPGMAIETSRIGAVIGHDLRARLPEVTARTLVVCAEDDAITPLPFSRELASLISGARLATLPMGGHFAPQVDPQRYNRIVLDFLAEEAP